MSIDEQPIATPLQRRLDGARDLAEGLEIVLCRARKTLRIFDNRLERAFDHPDRIAALRAVLRADPSHRVRIVLHETSNLPGDCPRLLALQKLFSNALLIHRTEGQGRRASDPIGIADDNACVHRFHFEQPGASLILDDPDAVRPLALRFEEIWESSTPAVTGTVLGL